MSKSAYFLNYSKHHPRENGDYSRLDLPPEKESSNNVRLGLRKGGFPMGRKSYTPEQIINKLREAEIHTNRVSLLPNPAERPVSPSRPTIASVKNTAVCGLSRQGASKSLRKKIPASRSLLQNYPLNISIRPVVPGGHF